MSPETETTARPSAIAARLVTFSGHLLSVFLLYLFVRTLHGGYPILAELAATYLIVGPGLKYVEAYFGTPVYALLGPLLPVWTRP